MKKLLAALLLALGALGVALGLAAPAQADTSDYIWALEHDQMADFYGPKAMFVDLGFRVCADLASGYTPGQISNFIYYNNSYSFTPIAAQHVVYQAINHLC